jgi:hypothetical protein
MRNRYLPRCSTTRVPREGRCAASAGDGSARSMVRFGPGRILTRCPLPSPQASPRSCIVMPKIGGIILHALVVCFNKYPDLHGEEHIGEQRRAMFGDGRELEVLLEEILQCVLKNTTRLVMSSTSGNPSPRPCTDIAVCFNKCPDMCDGH